MYRFESYKYPKCFLEFCMLLFGKSKCQQPKNNFIVAPPRLPNGLPPSLVRVKQIVGPTASKRLFFHQGDITRSGMEFFDLK